MGVASWQVIILAYVHKVCQIAYRNITSLSKSSCAWMSVMGFGNVRDVGSEFASSKQVPNNGDVKMKLYL
ncbi:MAG: hypothetical protein ACRYFS_20775 [Janthinobacterium lividum]